jgi:type II secretory pathway component PulM
VLVGAVVVILGVAWFGVLSPLYRAVTLAEQQVLVDAMLRDRLIEISSAVDALGGVGDESSGRVDEIKSLLTSHSISAARWNVNSIDNSQVTVEVQDADFLQLMEFFSVLQANRLSIEKADVRADEGGVTVSATATIRAD